MAKGWHNKHISTKWGIAIFGWLLVSMVLLIPILAQNQDFRSHASRPAEGGAASAKVPRNYIPPGGNKGSAGACASLGKQTIKGSTTSAKCQFTTTACAGGYVDNYCGGGSNYKCCVVSNACAKAGGKCITVGGAQAKPAGGKYLSGLCPGPSNVKCYKK